MSKKETMTNELSEIDKLDYAERAKTIPDIAKNLEGYKIHLALRYHQVRNNTILEGCNDRPLKLVHDAIWDLHECTKKLNLAIKVQEAEDWARRQDG